MNKSQMIAELIWLFNWQLRHYIYTLETYESDNIIIRNQSCLIGVFESLKAVRIIDDKVTADNIFKAILHRDIETLRTLEISIES